jgi:divalent metal cation (Fe/Co/Zn/Cd) transporter
MVSPELVDQAHDMAPDVDEVEVVGELRIRWIGHRLHAEARIMVDRDLGVVAAHTNAEETPHAMLHRLPMLAGAVVHVDPCPHAGGDPPAVTAHHFHAAG